jgi:hypothetical protein
MKRGFLDLLDPSNDPEFFWQVISGPPCISGTDIFYQIIAHVHFREILSGYFLFSRFDWSIFVTQLVAKHMKEIIT